MWITLRVTHNRDKPSTTIKCKGFLAFMFIMTHIEIITINLGHRMNLETILKITGNTINEINSFFAHWYEHTELARLETIRALKAVGHLSAKYKQESSENFKCPLHNFTLIKPCSLSSCQYHLSTIQGNLVQQQLILECKNCLINCLDLSKNNRLSATEVSGVLGLTPSEINICNATAISKIRRAKIKEQIEKHQIPRFRYLKVHCVSCGLFIQDELEMNLYSDLIIQSDTHGWCSDECKDKKPKWQFVIEKEFECDYIHALSVGFMLYNNIENIGGIFSLNKEILQKNKNSIQKNLDFLKKTFFSR